MWAVLLCVTVLGANQGVVALQQGSINVVTNRLMRTERSSTNCGRWGWKSCTTYRGVYYLVHTCAPGYRSIDNVGCPHPICDGDINPTGLACTIHYPDSHIIYSDGRTQHNSGGTCTSPERCINCNEGFYASPNRCRMCTAISNCDLEACTSSSDQVCSRCEGVVLELQGHRAYTVTPDRRQCIKACSWRSDSTRCYPGTCDIEHATSCKCMDEFSGTHCKKIDTMPTILYNYLKLSGPGNSSVDLPDDPSLGSPQNESWTPITDSKRIQYKFTSKFIPVQKLPTAHAYIENYKVGIIDGVASFDFIRDRQVLKSTSRPCWGATALQPEQAVFKCEDDISVEEILTLPVRSGDYINVTFSTTNGGYVHVRNKESDILSTEYFVGKTQVNRYLLGFDSLDPYHCIAEDDAVNTENVTCFCESLVNVTNCNIINDNDTDCNLSVGNVTGCILNDGNMTNCNVTDWVTREDNITCPCEDFGNVIECNTSDGNRTKCNILDGNITRCNIDIGNITECNITDDNNIECNTTDGNILLCNMTGINVTDVEAEMDDVRCPHENMVNITAGPAESPIAVWWDGWLDDVGVFTYHLAVYDLVDTNVSDDNSQLIEKSFVQTQIVWHPQLVDDIVLPNPGAYALVFSAYDQADNHKSARRIFISDRISRVETLPETELLVTTAADITDFLWQWSVESINVDWHMRYINFLHHKNGWLKSVSSIPDVEPAYDDNGFSRGIDRVSNIQGSVEYQTGFLVDHLGGNNITEPPPDSEFVSQNLTMNQTITPELVDGDTLRFWIRAYDVRREYLEENRTIHIDTSPPIIENLWITREDRLNISVHSIEDFNEMTFEWLSYDIHSGLEMVTWRLFDNFTGEDILHGTDRLSPQGQTMTLEECEAGYGEYARGANCYCTPGVGCFHRHYQVTPRVVLGNITHGGVFHDKHRGVHDSDYFLEVKVMNQAKLNTTLTFQITIDASPPHPGVVHDGQLGQPEVDFQDSLQIHGHWDGFFDKESGVKFYQYMFSERCLNAENFGLTLEQYNVTETYSSHATFRAPTTGKYYLTVVAYNSALEPSSPVCSDGVSVDQTPPVISHVSVDNSRVKPGLVSTSDGEIWFIDKLRRRSKINDYNDDCRSKSTSIETLELELVPLHKFHNGTLVKHQSAFCEDKGPFPSHFINTFYIFRQQHLSVNWSCADTESGIYDYEVGLMSDVSGEAAPDIHPYTSTHHHPHYHSFHPGLNTGQQFYISVKAINKADLETIKVLGPVVVHNQIPQYTGEISVTLNQDHLVAKWAANTFTDPEAHYLKYEIAVGTEDVATSILQFISLKSGGGCTLSSPPTCAAVPLTDLPWDLHHSHVYHVSIRVTNIVDLSTVALSQPYVHDVRLPSTGLVMEVCPPQERETFRITEHQESDYQLSTTSLTARWFGFDDGVLNVTYRVGVGSSRGTPDLVPFQDVGQTLEHTFNNLHLRYSKVYFVVVEAHSQTGKIMASSDGTRIIKNNLQDTTVILDGLGCINNGKATVNFTNDTSNWTPAHYEMLSPLRYEEDLLYQKSTSTISAHWNRSQDLSMQYPDVQWRLEKIMPKSDDIWHSETEFAPIGTSDHLIVTGLSLEAGHTYRAGVRFCAATVCTRPVHSDGVTILHSSPEGGDMHVSYTETDAGSEMNVSMTRFYDPDLPVSEEAYAVVDRYEWCLTDDSHSGRTLTKWTPIDNLVFEGNETKILIQLPKALDFTKCRRLAVRGYNKLGLYTVVSADVRNCSAYDQRLVTPAAVIDALGEKLRNTITNGVSLELNARWPHADVDYTPYTNMLSAVWPNLRHRNYTWAVVSGDKVDPTSHYKRDNLMTVSDPCALPDFIKCGHTEKEFVNINMMGHLWHGSRFYICVHADAMMVKNEKWNQSLEEVNTCSDGVTVDLTPPEGGRVFIGGLTGNGYHTSKSEMDVYWDSFVDVEESGMSPHHSGISHYEVSLGTIRGGREIMHKTVGLVNHVTFHHLNLHDGNTVYATVTATDFVNQSTSVMSQGITIDFTPPFETGKRIIVYGVYITSPIFDACWDNVLVDEESGMESYQVSVGTRPGYHNILPVSVTDEDCMTFDITNSAVDGHSVFVTLKGFNKAGLHTLVTSRPLVMDTSPPSIGHVYDGQITMVKEDMKDKDFVTRISDMGAYWEGFSDPHSSISHYLVKVGTCQGCQDVVAEHNVGGRTSLQFHDVAFVPGIKYYVEVSGCNMAGLCSVGRSDGVILDITPPVAGALQDGTFDNDIQVQASRYFLGCKWLGFYDPESGLDHYEWRVGTTTGGDDILPARNVALEVVVYHTLSNGQLPIGKSLYSTVVAYNKAGMKTEASSNGFLVDDTAPVVMTAPRHVNDLSTTSTAFSRTTLKVVWEIEDDESFIERQYLSISSHQLGDFNTSLMEVHVMIMTLADSRPFTQFTSPSSLNPLPYAICHQIPGLLREFTFTQLKLHDGSLYTVKVTACNMAGLCTNTSTEEILLDSSPPNPGGLAVETDHAARLSRHQTGWMTWTHTSLSLAWLGFSDLHSGIQHYILTVGSQEFLSDLNKNSEPEKIPHNNTGLQHDDEGFVQTFIINTEDISFRDYVYVAIWAVNGVGLKSKTLHHKLTLVPGGDLELVRRCQRYNCHGSCVCAVQDGTCSLNDGCSQQDGGVVMVTDITGLHLSTGKDEDFSCFDNYMAAEWTPSDTVNADVEYYEVSVGESDFDTPEGVFNIAVERVWFDVGQNSSAVITLSTGRELSPGHRYSFFVRTWFSDDKFSISKSNGLLIDTTRPQISQIRGSSVKEVSSRSPDRDVDFQRSRDRVRVAWNNTFLPGQTGLLRYVVYISTSPGGHSIHTSGDLTSTSYTTEGLSLEPNTVYYTSVLAYDKAGLVSWAYSDGVQVDVEPPVSGIVYDGQGPHDVDYQMSSTTVSVSWHGFFDTDSAIVKYHWCVGVADNQTDCSILDWRDVGLHSEATLEVPTIKTGTRVWSKVYAEDDTGHKSEIVLSDGVVIDTTPPQPQDVIYLGENMIENPSFEDIVQGSLTSNCSSLPPENWQLENQSCVDVTVDSYNARDGQSYIVLSGMIRQNISSLDQRQKYMVTLHIAYMLSVKEEDKAIQGIVSVDDVHHRFSLDPHRCKGTCNNNNILWNTIKVSFIASQTTTQLMIGTTSREMKMAVDDVRLQRVSYDERMEQRHNQHLEVHSVFHHHWSSLHVAWNFKDEESPITEYKWAVGLTRGGTQIQEFKSVGKDSEARISGLRLIHGSEVFVTIMATNAAGLSTMSHSSPIVVDMTPPVITYVNDGLGSDTPYIDPGRMSVNWMATDDESDIDFCEWAIGFTPLRDDVKGFDRVPSGQFFAKTNLTDKATSPNMKIYSTVRCFNKAGLTSVTSSDGVVLVTGSRESSLSGVELLQGRSLVFRNTGTCHNDPYRIRIKWNELVNPMIQLTIVHVEGEKVNYQTRVPTYLPYSFCELGIHHLASLTDYNISARPLDFLGEDGELSSLRLRQRGTTPIVKNNVTIKVVTSPKREITLDWSDVFTSPWPELTYEVDIGSVLGGADIVERYLTRSTYLSLKLVHVHKTKLLFVTVTAADSCGGASHFTQQLTLKD